MTDDKFLDESLKPSAITPDGYWVLPDGHKCDLRHVQLELPDGRGKEWVVGVALSAEGVYDVCPECKTRMNESMILIMENYHYLVARCCDKLLLYENQKLNVRKMR